jgi:hypothetical protein
MANRWVVVSLPTPSLVAVVTKPFRSEEAAQKVADSLNASADAADMGFNATAQVCLIESVAAVRRQIKAGDIL